MEDTPSQNDIPQNSQNDINGLEYINNTLYKGPLDSLSISSLVSFFFARHVISDLYDHRPDIVSHPFIKIIGVFCILYMNIKHLKISIVLFFIYIMLIDNYSHDTSSKNNNNNNQ